MKVLDLFCCSGGASMGYKNAGFEVIGVDIKKQPNYPFQFIQSDALEFLRNCSHIKSFDLIHASPPCQGYSKSTKANSRYVHYSQGKDTPKLIEPLRDILKEIGVQYVIENVSGAKNVLINPVLLTGYMFNLPIERKRYFESSFPIIQPPKVVKRGFAKKYAEQHGIDYRDMSVTGKSRRKGCIETWKKIMGMPWANRAWELAEAIPPAYTEYIGNQFKNFTEIK